MARNRNKRSNYPPPVDQLLHLGEDTEGFDIYEEWADYLQLGFTHEHVPDLIRMALDVDLHEAPSESPKLWAPVHAWRTLAQLQAKEASKPLLALFSRLEEEFDEWVMEELPVVYAMIGGEAVEDLARYLADASNVEDARIAVADCLGCIGEEKPEARLRCITVLCEQLKKYKDNGAQLNSFLVCNLLDLKAVATIDVIRQAFAEKCVDEEIVGDLQDVEIDLGLRVAPPGYQRPWRDEDEDEDDYDEDYDGEYEEDEDDEFADDDWQEEEEDEEEKVEISRNDPCPCGSGRKYKNCCLKRQQNR